MPATHLSATAALLSWLHPAIMIVALCLAALSLWKGLVIRQRRRLRQRREKDDWRRHVRWSQPAVILCLVGFAAGPISAVVLRHWTPFATLHAWVGVCAAALYAFAGWLGLRVKRGDRRGVIAHGNLGILALILSLVAVLTGLSLLP